MDAMYVVMFRAKDALQCEAKVFGPWTDYLDACAYLEALPPASECEHKYIERLADPNYDADGKAEWQGPKVY